MIQKLVLIDFMAHSRTELPLGPGLTALVGANNIGKSAVVEGLRCLTTNPSVKRVIRHGAKKARVEAHLEDGTVVAWIRAKSWAKYEILRPGKDEPETHAKLGRGKDKVPADVRALLRLDEVELEDRKDAIDVHLGNQRAPVFLLDEPPAAMASFFAASTESVHLLNMQQALKERVKEAKATVRRTGQRQAALAVELDALRALPDLNLQLADLRRQKDALEREQRSLPRLESTARTIVQARTEAVRLEKRGGVLEKLAGPPVLEATRPLAQLEREVATLEGRIHKGKTRRSALEPLTDPPRLAPEAPLAELLSARRRLEAERGRARDQAKSLGNLMPPPEVQPVVELARLLRELADAETQAAAVRKQLAEADTAVERFESELPKRLEALGSCPTCGSPMDSEHFLHHREGGHG